PGTRRRSTPPRTGSRTRIPWCAARPPGRSAAPAVPARGPRSSGRVSASRMPPSAPSSTRRSSDLRGASTEVGNPRQVRLLGLPLDHGVEAQALGGVLLADPELPPTERRDLLLPLGGQEDPPPL